jgi:6-pyruvoyltetrahydropterin/6-carboxytetrahydropterin synthase
MEGFERYVEVEVSLGGEPDLGSGYLVNIKQIDEVVRREGLPILREFAGMASANVAGMVGELFERFRGVWPQIEQVGVSLSPFSAFSVLAREFPMVRFSHKFEFSAAHRLHNPELSEKANVELFGKCNNPNGHGHNYELQVTLRGKLIPVAKLEEVVAEQVIQRFDHKFLNLDTLEFKAVNPTVENIARIIYGLLRGAIAGAGGELAGVTVWETPKTWCEYSE